MTGNIKAIYYSKSSIPTFSPLDILTSDSILAHCITLPSPTHGSCLHLPVSLSLAPSPHSPPITSLSPHQCEWIGNILQHHAIV